MPLRSPRAAPDLPIPHDFRRITPFGAARRSADHTVRAQHYNEIYGMIADILRTGTTAQWLALFERCDIPCAPMNDLAALIDDPHLASVGFFQTLTHPTEGRIRYTGIPSRWDGSNLKISRHAPLLGEHSVAVLGEAGFAQDEIETMIRSGATRDGALKAGAESAPSERIAGKSPMS